MSMYDSLGIDELLKDFRGAVDNSTSSFSQGAEETKQSKDSEMYNTYKAIYKSEEVNQLGANMQGKNVAEILRLSNYRQRFGCSYNSFECYDIELEFYEDIVNQSPVLQKTLEEGEELLPTFKYLLQDFYLSLVKYEAVVLPEEYLHDSVRLNRSIINKLINTPEYISLRQNCRLNDFIAAIGTEVLGQEAIAILRDALAKVKDFEKKKQALDDLMKKEEEMDDIIQQLEELDDLMQEAKDDLDFKQMQEIQEQQESLQLSIAEKKALANQMAQQCDDLVLGDDIVNNVVNTMTNEQVVTKANTEVSEVKDCCEAWGLTDGGKNRVAFQEKKSVIETIRKSSKLKELTNALGKLKETAITEQKKKAKDGAVEIKSVTTGDKIQDTLPSDRLNLVHEATKKDFYRRMSEKNLLVYSKEANKQKNKGPIIACVDTSGSMAGKREVWSKALTIAVLEIAQLQKRDFACILYSHHADPPIIIKKDEIAPKKVINIAEDFSNGGTSFEPPLNEAMKLIEDATFKNADILFITDGESDVSDSFLKRYKAVKEAKEFQTLGVLIDVGRRSCSDNSLKSFCDNVICVSNIADLQDGTSNINRAIFGAL